jgi:prepilin-type N-terminal cleavage/methylation domain-containing protein
MIMEKNNSQNGFTLIEVLIAIALLTIGILGAATMQIASIGGNSHAIRITEAATFAEAKIEEFMNLPYDDPLLDDDGDRTGKNGLNDTNVVGERADGGPEVHGDFTVYWNVMETINVPVDTAKNIRIIVVRSDKGIVKRLTVDYLKANDN